MMTGGCTSKESRCAVQTPLLLPLLVMPEMLGEMFLLNVQTMDNMCSLMICVSRIENKRGAR